MKIFQSKVVCHESWLKLEVTKPGWEFWVPYDGKHRRGDNHINHVRVGFKDELEGGCNDRLISEGSGTKIRQP